ncbi:adhesion G-protein coupled receptor G6 isoform X2 [Octopus bimaculoides]|uniref:adhesion G-protein coupled receptor G6 isoform X2 n=1 Tax=Octopus bimaculoides TaxID=37653 RepID=UPI00071C7D7D|nr:adhesion G-protein coupled receptor G6 isoform X2 [Octopus bimaculoides]|eukprot:XP_014790558.1 PREDICTED: G-protein coupled receptor 126-like isoform X2 [Octopus bimaculoides]
MLSSQTKTSLKCSPFTGIWQEPDMSECYNTEWITRRLKNIRSQVIDEGNIGDISKEVLNVSQKSVYFKQQDIDLAVDILEKMAPLISNVSANITLDNILLGINNIMNTPEKVLAEAEQADRSVSRLLDIIETIPEKIPLEEQQVTAIYSNLGIGVAKVNKDTFDGLFYGVFYGTNETEAQLYNHSHPDSQQEDIQTISFISLPKSLPKHLKVEEISAFSRIFFFSTSDDKLYRVTQNSSANANTKINSYIIAANVANISVSNLDEPVNISFLLINQNVTSLKCVYLDETPGEDPHWSTKGCKISDYVPGKKVVCSCDHLTSFALLMDVHRNEDDVKHVKPISIISLIGCGISVVFLVLTIIIHVCFNCWLSQTYFYATLLAPVGIILIFNLTIFILIIWRLILIQNSKKFGHKRRKVRVFGIVGLFFFLGLTWFLAFFAVDKAAEVFKYLFAIVNTLQGMFIFIFYCICKKDTRDIIIKYVTIRKRAPLPTGRNKTSGNETEDKSAETKF